MYWIDNTKKDDLRRNTLSIRFTDAEHLMVSNAAWRTRISASGLIREILLSGLEERGLTIKTDDVRKAAHSSRRHGRKHREGGPMQ